MFNKWFKEAYYTRFLIFIIAQLTIIPLSKSIQTFLSSVVLYNNLDHLLLIFFVVIPYLAALCMVVLLGLEKVPVSENVKEIKFDGRDVLSVCLLLIIAIIVFHRISLKPLPIGFDTPYYLAMAKNVLEQGLQIDLFSRWIYSGLLGIGLWVAGNDVLLLGKMLWVQILLVILANYFLVRYVTKSKLIAFTSSFLWIFWSRTARLIEDLHSNVFGIFLMLVLIYLLLSIVNDFSYKKLAVLLLILIILPFIHQLTFIVFFVYLLALFVTISLSKHDIMIFKFKQYNLLNKIAKAILALSPVITFLTLEYLKALHEGRVLIATQDLLRKWWPEVEIWDFQKFVAVLGGWPIFILAELGVLYIVITRYRKNVLFRNMVLYLITSLMLFQNNIFGLHALPERFAVFSYLPIFASMSFLILGHIPSLRRINLSIILNSKRIKFKLNKINFVIWFIALLTISLLIIPPQMTYIAHLGSTISVNEYNALTYLRDNYLSKVCDETNCALMIPRSFKGSAMSYWLKEILYGYTTVRIMYVNYSVVNDPNEYGAIFIVYPDLSKINMTAHEKYYVTVMNLFNVTICKIEKR